MEPEIRLLGRVDYLPTYRAMQAFTAVRGPDSPDEIWLCEHPPVFTQGLAGRTEHLVSPGDIPVVLTDRGGQVTYHGPGQVVAYALIDLRRAGYFIKEYVYRLEEAAIRTLAQCAITGHRVPGAPGIYVRLDDPGGHARLSPCAGKGAGTTGQPDFLGLGKIAALGIKVSRHCTYHGIALNVTMDLGPFERINPCGYRDLQTVDLSTMGASIGWDQAATRLGQKLATYLAP